MYIYIYILYILLYQILASIKHEDMETSLLFLIFNEINNDSHRTYNTYSKIIFKMTMLKSNLCDSSITITRTEGAEDKVARQAAKETDKRMNTRS